MIRARILLALSTLTACGLLIVPAVSAASSAEHFAEVLDTPSTFSDPSQSGQRNSVIVLQSWESARAEELKAANPNLIVLAYQNLGSMTQGLGPGGTSSSGVNYSEANTAHPEWFLKEANGARIAEEDYPYLWMADIGEPGYQQLWTENVIRLLKDGPWNGIVMDDTNTTPRYHVYPQWRIVKYPNDADYQTAVRSMLAYAGPRIQAAGKLAIPNIGAWTEYPEVAKEWLQYVSGGEDEMFVKWSSVPGEGYRTAGDWKTQLEEVRSTESMGKRFLAITQATMSDTGAVRYGWASALLDGNGNTSFFAASNYDSETWSSEYEIALGEPTAAASEIGGGAWGRRFQHGLVIVNPSSSTVKVSFGGTYSGTGLTDATEAAVGSNTALILTSAGEENKVRSELGGEAAGWTSSKGAAESSSGSESQEGKQTPVEIPSSTSPVASSVHHETLVPPRTRRSPSRLVTARAVSVVSTKCRRQVASSARRRMRSSRAVRSRAVASCVRTATAAAHRRERSSRAHA